MLLDPCVFSDGQLLGCQKENGNSCAASVDDVERRRAEESIEIYHLNYEPTCKRRHSVAVSFLADLDEAKRRFELMLKDRGKKSDFVKQANRLLASIAPTAEFSGEMRFLMRGERNEDHPWIQNMLEA